MALLANSGLKLLFGLELFDAFGYALLELLLLI